MSSRESGVESREPRAESREQARRAAGADTDDSRQRRLLASLKALFGGGEIIETHISRVLLAGEFAWKIKKPVNPGFLDFTTLEARRHFCREELRLNRRLAPDIYLEVVAFAGCAETPEIVGEDAPNAFEYAVKMRRFPQDGLADALLAREGLLPRHMDELAEVMARFHTSLPAADPAMGHGTPERIVAPVRGIFDVLGRMVSEPAEQERLARLDHWCEMSFSALKPLMEARRRAGFVRECHGDLHLGNIAVLPEGVRVFDGIEFDPELRWVDIQNEVAFLSMDCAFRGREDLGMRFLDRWLSRSGDYEGVALWRWYAVYRALVRAMVAMLRSAQPGQAPERVASEREDGLAHVRLAERLAHPSPPVLILTHGYAGSGKTTFAQALVEGLPAIRLRSDVERKRLFGLGAEERGGQALYGGEVTRATYGELARLAGLLLDAGHGVVVDATCLGRWQRELLHSVARERGMVCLILDCQAEASTLRRWVVERLERGGDASDATPEVLERQLISAEALSDDEGPVVQANTEIDSPRDVLERMRKILNPHSPSSPEGGTLSYRASSL